MATIVYTLEAGFNVNYPPRDTPDEDKTERINGTPIAPTITQDELVKRVADKSKVSNPNLTFDKMKEILSQTALILQERLKPGDAVNMNLMSYKLCMTGSFANTDGEFNPEAHRSIIDLTPAAILLDAIKKGAAKILGVDASEMRIILIAVNTETGAKYIHISNDC
jgi:hypothetical protein